MKRRRRPRVLWGLLLCAAGSVVWVLAGVLSLDLGPRHRHPEPRPHVSAAHVMHAEQVAGAYGTAAADAYRIAAAIPAILDGVHCRCNCDATFGHYSLLSCFEEMHGAACQICQDQARLAAAHVARGASLAQVRKAIDRRWG